MARPPIATPAALLAALAGGSRTRAELQVQLGGISQPTVSRLVRAAGTAVVALGRGPATRYAAVRRLPGLAARLPLHAVDAAGGLRLLGWLWPLAHGEYWCEFSDRPGELHPGLPYFLQDMRVQGFMGREFATRHGQDLGLPPRLADWDDDAQLLAMARHGEDLPGNLVLGDDSLHRLYNIRDFEPLDSRADVRATYARRVEAGLQADVGSSAGGEQPKFITAWRDGDAVHHAIVKFSPAGTTPAAERWRDLLRAECLALAMLAAAGLPAARTECLLQDGRLFLESERFDRIGLNGRRSVLSLQYADMHHYGQRGTWSDVAMRLHADRLLTADDARTIRLLDTFGALIANTDRHLGNLSLFTDGDPYALAPAYDMLPMLYRPLENGEVVARDFRPPLPTAANADVWALALALAIRYWQQLAVDAALSADFRHIAVINATALTALLSLPVPQ